MDREARDPFELLDEIENELGIGTYADQLADRLAARSFKGVYDRASKTQVIAFDGCQARTARDRGCRPVPLDDPIVGVCCIGSVSAAAASTMMELLDGAGVEFDLEQVRDGQAYRRYSSAPH